MRNEEETRQALDTCNMPHKEEEALKSFLQYAVGLSNEQRAIAINYVNCYTSFYRVSEYLHIEEITL